MWKTFLEYKREGQPENPLRRHLMNYKENKLVLQLTKLSLMRFWSSAWTAEVGRRWVYWVDRYSVISTHAYRLPTEDLVRKEFPALKKI